MKDAGGMDGIENSSRTWLPVLAQVASALIIFGSGLVLLGWTFGLKSVVGLLPEEVVMSPMTALTFVVAGGALWGVALQQQQKADGRFVRGVKLALGSLVLLVGAIKLTDYLFGLGFHVDQVLFTDKVAGAGGYPPGEMAPNTALNFFLCGLGLLFVEAETRRGFRVAQVLVLLAGFTAVQALIGYEYGVPMLYRVGRKIPMSLDAAVGFTLFCLGFLAARPRQGIMRVITSATSGGALARRLLPMAILIPWALGSLLVLGVRAGYFAWEFTVAAFAAACIVIFAVLIWRNAKLLFLMDQDRVRTERRLTAQHAATRILAEAQEQSSGLRRTLEVVCQKLEWQAGALWTVDEPRSALRCAEWWHACAPGLREFIEVSRSLTFEKGIGLPGQAWANGQPVWVLDFSQADPYPRAAAAAQAGLHGAFGFPIALGQEVFGIMEFFSREVQPPDPALLEMGSALGGQVGLFIERIRAEAQLRQTSVDLARSNTDLQQFAYVASHDLFEPLRMVTSYVQLLRDRYKSKLDRQGEEFIAFALDGAKRMEALIHDLLAYSRVDMRGRSLEPTEAERVFQEAVTNLKVAIEESGAVIERGPLPRVRADWVQLSQVFQNLIGNAIKFHGAESPRIQVEAHQRDHEWLFSVRDNGIGIDPKQFERIFVIFQRLHTRQEYAGTGMGLAICKKIIERHGGRIWLESVPGKGSTFFFTLPMMEEETLKLAA